MKRPQRGDFGIKEEKELWLSRADVINKTGISASSYARAVAELKEKGYLVYTSSNHYDFYAIPQEAPAPAPARKFTLPSPASEEEDYKRADIQPLRPQVRERKPLTTDAVYSRKNASAHKAFTIIGAPATFSPQFTQIFDTIGGKKL